MVLISVLNEYSLRWGQFTKFLSGVSCWAAGGVNSEPYDIRIDCLLEIFRHCCTHASAAVDIAALGLIFKTDLRSVSILQSKEIDI